MTTFAAVKVGQTAKVIATVLKGGAMRFSDVVVRDWAIRPLKSNERVVTQRAAFAMTRATQRGQQRPETFGIDPELVIPKVVVDQFDYAIVRSGEEMVVKLAKSRAHRREANAALRAAQKQAKALLG